MRRTLALSLASLSLVALACSGSTPAASGGAGGTGGTSSLVVDTDKGPIEGILQGEATRAFLEFARDQGNDLITPVPQFRFRGLKPGDRWCVCAATWRQAYEAGVAPPVILEATHEEALAVVPLAALKECALRPG